MTHCRAPILQPKASGLTVAVLLTALCGAPSAIAEIDYDTLYTDVNSAGMLIEAFDSKPSSADWLLVDIAEVYMYFTTGGIARKSAPNYGALTPKALRVDAVHCAGSSGVALAPSAKFAYMSGGFGSPGRLCGFVIDPVTHALTPVTPAGATPVAAPSNPRATAIEPSGRFMYVAGDVEGVVSGYAVNRITGEPTALPGSPFRTYGSLPTPMVIDRSGRYMYVGQGVGNFDGSIAVFAIDPTSGSLSHIPGSPFPNVADGGRIAALALSPDGRFLFTGGSALTTYAVNPATGAPTRIASRGGYNYGLTIDPTGRFLYAPDDTDGLLHGYSIAADGALAPAGVPQAIGSVTRGITAIASVADLVYVGNPGTGKVYGFRLNPNTGALTPVAGSPFASQPNPSAFAARANLPPSIQVDAGDNVVASVGVYGGHPPYTWSIADGALPPGMSLNSTTGIVSGVLNAAGTHSFTVQVADSLGATATTTKSITVLGSGVAAPVAVVEFYNASLDHYFVTWIAEEIAKLDNGTFKGWARTGLSFNAFATTQSGTSAVCRIYIPPGKGDGHFFGRDANECDGTMNKNPTFILESSTFLYLFPPTLGNCAAGQVPVYRVFSNRADANHRYTTSRTVRDQMVGKGWLAEGDGADTVVMCAPA